MEVGQAPEKAGAVPVHICVPAPETRHCLQRQEGEESDICPLSSRITILLEFCLYTKLGAEPKEPTGCWQVILPQCSDIYFLWVLLFGFPHEVSRKTLAFFTGSAFL